MGVPRFTISGLLNATAVFGAFIAAWKLLNAWWPPESTDAALNHGVFMLMGITCGCFKQKYWWWPGAWLGLAVAMAILIGIYHAAQLFPKNFFDSF